MNHSVVSRKDIPVSDERWQPDEQVLVFGDRRYS